MRIALFVLLCVLCAGRAPAAEPVVIGAVYNLTGSMASIDGPGLEGMKLAVERINGEGGVLGRPLRLEVRDGGSDVGRCREAVRDLARAKVSAVAGLGDSDYALAAGQEAAGAGIPFLTAGATLPDLPRVVGPYFFMACFGDDAQAKAVAKFMLRRKGAAAALVLVDKDSAYALALAKYFVKAYTAHGGTVVERGEFSAAADPFGGDVPQCLKTGGCRGVFVAGTPEDAVPSVTALRAAGYAGPVFSGDGFDTPLLEGLGDKTAAGVYFSTHVSYDDPRPRVRAFVRAWREAHGDKPVSGFAALGYDAAGLVADAVARAGSSAPKRVRAALAATRGYAGVTGEISYLAPESPPRKPVTIVRVGPEGRAFEKEVLP